jgi:4-diphosphocytidyl-2-C-methyl-D-erythritol kinase
VALADTLTLAGPAGPDAEPGAASDALVIEGDPACPVADNLVLRATEGFRRLASDAGVTVPGARLHLAKRIPMAAGLAGGSSDAAATLRLLAARHPDGASRPDLRRLAARLGADVPFFLDGAGAALVTGIGEMLEPLPPPIDPVGILLLTPAEGSSTPAVFRAWDESAGASPRSTASEAVDQLAGMLRRGVDATTLAAHASVLRSANDLWLPATLVSPGMASLRDTLERVLGRPILLTGSGSTLFALYPSPATATVAANELRAAGNRAAVRIRVTSSTGPHIETISSRRDP